MYFSTPFQICGLESPPDSSPIATEAETDLPDGLNKYDSAERENGHLPNKLVERRLSTYKDKEAETVPPVNTNEPIVPTRQLSAVGEVIVGEFNKFRNLENSRYFYFSEMHGLQQAESIQTLQPFFERKNEHYWLNITNPSAQDFDYLIENYAVNELTINDILEGK